MYPEEKNLKFELLFLRSELAKSSFPKDLPMSKKKNQISNTVKY